MISYETADADQTSAICNNLTVRMIYRNDYNTLWNEWISVSCYIYDLSFRVVIFSKNEFNNIKRKKTLDLQNVRSKYMQRRNIVAIFRRSWNWIDFHRRHSYYNFYDTCMIFSSYFHSKVGENITRMISIIAFFWKDCFVRYVSLQNDCSAWDTTESCVCFR